MNDPDTILEAGGLRVAFFRDGDRVAHRFEVYDAATDAWSTALESIEGSADEAWPESPPFQQLHVERRRDGPIIFLVGMAGRSHWSAAVDVAPDRDSLRFDVAVRIQQPPESLGSTYRVCRPSAALRCDAAASSMLQEADERRRRVVPRFTAEASLTPRPPATISWKYEVYAVRGRP